MANSTFNTNSATFDDMMKRFSILTVMNAKVYAPLYNNNFDKKLSVVDILKFYSGAKPLCELDTLKIANVTVEGPSKTVTGGQYSNPLVKFGKTARLEMQDALGNADAIACLGGGILEWDTGETKNYKLHIGETFNGPKTVIGDTFFIDQKTGTQVKVKIIFYQVLPDSIFNLSQDAEGDATVFDLNGDLLATTIKVDDDDKGNYHQTGIFYSVIDAEDTKNYHSVVATCSNKESGTYNVHAATSTVSSDFTKGYNITKGIELTTGELASIKLTNAGFSEKEKTSVLDNLDKKFSRGDTIVALYA